MLSHRNLIVDAVDLAKVWQMGAEGMARPAAVIAHGDKRIQHKVATGAAVLEQGWPALSCAGSLNAYPQTGGTSMPKFTRAAPLEQMAADATAPVIFFDQVPTFSSLNGVVGVTLANTLQGVKDGQAFDTFAAAAYLRCSLQGAMALRRALDEAIRLAHGGHPEIPRIDSSLN